MKVTVEGFLIVLAGAALGAIILGAIAPYLVAPIQKAIATSKTTTGA